ncbi:MAG: hypothetical protein LUQ17_02405, partial [Methanomicrobiales archaeon]|nr:hypothetical protein [Methanomicrobiales archaeon]
YFMPDRIKCDLNMQCSHCRGEAIIFQPYSGQHLCGHHLIVDVERKAKRTIRKNHWIRSGDRVLIGLDGCPASNALLHFLIRTFGNRRDITFTAVTIDDGTGRFRSFDRIERLARSYGLPWERRSYQDSLGDALAEIAGSDSDGSPCISCRAFRDRLLTHVAKEQGATRIALGSTLEQEAEVMFGAVIEDDMSVLLPRTDISIRPFSLVPENEVVLYGCLHGVRIEQHACPNASRRPAARAGKILRAFASSHPSTHYALLNLKETLSSLCPNSESLTFHEEAGEGTGAGQNREVRGNRNAE